MPGMSAGVWVSVATPSTMRHTHRGSASAGNGGRRQRAPSGTGSSQAPALAASACWRARSTAWRASAGLGVRLTGHSQPQPRGERAPGLRLTTAQPGRKRRLYQDLAVIRIRLPGRDHLPEAARRPVQAAVAIVVDAVADVLLQARQPTARIPVPQRARVGLPAGSGRWEEPVTQPGRQWCRGGIVQHLVGSGSGRGPGGDHVAARPRTSTPGPSSPAEFRIGSRPSR